MDNHKDPVPFHPREDPKIPGPPTAEKIRETFAGNVDFQERALHLGGDPHKPMTMFSILGMVRNERASDYVLKPMAEDARLRGMSMDAALDWMLKGGLYNMALTLRDDMDQVANDLVWGNAIFTIPGRREVLSCFVPTEEKRAISPPENEPSLKGARDAFVEAIRTNTSLVRRRLRTPKLKIQEVIVGRQTESPVDLIYIEGLTNPDLVKEARKRLAEMDIDALLTTANLEEYLADTVKTPFPLLSYTERPDRFCAGIAEGRVGVLADGIPMGFLLPGTLGQFFQTGEDRAKNWLEASSLRLLRYLCMLVTLYLPAFYVAAVSFHPEMLPASLAWSIVEAKVDVPFSTVFEVLILLLAFEIVQEAGLRLPSAIGTTVSILGGLVVGTAAVEAKITSPAVLIAVAVAGIAGYTMPSQEFSAALRIWRFLLVLAASIAGLFGILAVSVILVYHLACLESFGVPYLTPFAAVGGDQVDGVLRRPLPWVKFRERALKTQNRRNQK